MEFWPSGLYTVMVAVWPLAPGGGVTETKVEQAPEEGQAGAGG